jgi:hypothetical protein
MNQGGGHDPILINDEVISNQCSGAWLSYCYSCVYVAFGRTGTIRTELAQTVARKGVNKEYSTKCLGRGCQATHTQALVTNVDHGSV